MLTIGQIVNPTRKTCGCSMSNYAPSGQVRVHYADARYVELIDERGIHWSFNPKDFDNELKVGDRVTAFQKTVNSLSRATWEEYLSRGNTEKTVLTITDIRSGGIQVKDNGVMWYFHKDDLRLVTSAPKPANKYNVGDKVFLRAEMVVVKMVIAPDTYTKQRDEFSYLLEYPDGKSVTITYQNGTKREVTAWVVRESRLTQMPNQIGGYDVTIKDGKVFVGCEEITKEKLKFVRKLIENGGQITLGKENITLTEVNALELVVK